MELEEDSDNHSLSCLKNILPDQQTAGGKRVAQETMEQNLPQAKKPRLCTGVQMLPRRPSGELLHREPHLQALHVALTRRASQRAIDVAITGTAGVGKTELLLNFMTSHADEFHHVLWINAESKKTAESSILELAKMLEIEVNPNQIHMPLLLTKMYRLCSESKCLVVFDNAGNPEMLQEFLPPFHIDKSSMFTVVTSQYIDWDCETQVTVKSFTPEQSQEFLQECLTEAEDSEVKEISELLGNLPLALQIAVSYTKLAEKMGLYYDTRTYEINDFINELNSEPENFLKHQLATNENLGYTKSLYNLFSTTFNYIKKSNNGKLAFKLLILMAFIRPSDITIPMFRFYSGGENPYAFINNTFIRTKCFLLLEKYSLFTERDENMFSISPLLQIIIRENNDINNEVYLASFLKLVLKQSVYLKLDKQHRISDEFINIEHCKVAWNLAQEYPKLVQIFFKVPLAIENTLAFQKSSANECVEFVEKTLPKLQEFFGKDNEYCIKIQAPYLQSFYLLKEYKKMIKICCEMLPNSMNGSKLYLDIFELKAKALFMIGNLKKAYKIINYVYNSRVKCPNQNVHMCLNSLKFMCEISCKLYGSDPKALIQFEDVMKKIDVGMNERKAVVEFLHEIEQYFTNINESEKMLSLYDTFQNIFEKKYGVDNFYSLSNALNKSKFLCRQDKVVESWRVFKLIKARAKLDVKEYGDFMSILDKVGELLSEIKNR